MKAGNNNLIRITLIFAAFLLSPAYNYGQVGLSKTITRKIIINENPDNATIEISQADSLETNGIDTITHVIIGRKEYEIIGVPEKGKMKISVSHKPIDEFKGHWAGFDIGLSNFFSAPFDSSLPDEAMFMDLNGSKSVSVGINLFQHSIGLQKTKENLGLVTGLGLAINNYRLASDYVLIRNNQGFSSFTESERSIKKSKLTTSYLTVPLMLEGQIPSSKGHNPFFISAGIYGSFKIGSHTKVVYDDKGGKEKEVSRDDINVNSFKYGVSLRTGYGFIKLFANYDLSRLFQKDQGPELYPWTVGLSLFNF